MTNRLAQITEYFLKENFLCKLFNIKFKYSNGSRFNRDKWN